MYGWLQVNQSDELVVNNVRIDPLGEPKAILTRTPKFAVAKDVFSKISDDGVRSDVGRRYLSALQYVDDADLDYAALVALDFYRQNLALVDGVHGFVKIHQSIDELVDT